MTPETIAELKRKRYNATLVSVQKVHSDLLIMRVQPDTPRPIPTPGQYVVLGLGAWEPRFPGTQEEQGADEEKLIQRSYSISCPVLDGGGQLFNPEGVEWIEFYIVLVREAEKPPELTPRLFMLREKDRLFLGKKIVGHYTLHGVNPDDTVLFLGTGTGEAPHNYMLWDLLRRGHKGRIAMVTCVRQQRDLAYRALHEELMRRHPNYTYLPLTTREVVNEGQKVYIQDLITSGQLEERLGQQLDPARTHAFLCGNPKMIGLPVKNHETETLVYPQPPGVVEILEKRGFVLEQRHREVRGSIHFEEYW
jgi:ferredoxin--NADP+ reductase